jgi:hypothetical protein
MSYACVQYLCREHLFDRSWPQMGDNLNLRFRHVLLSRDQLQMQATLTATLEDAVRIYRSLRVALDRQLVFFISRPLNHWLWMVVNERAHL